MPWAAAESWRTHHPQRDLVRDLRAQLVELCSQTFEETEEYLVLNTTVSVELKRLPRWQRWHPITDPVLWRGTQSHRPRPGQVSLDAPATFATAGGARVVVTHEHRDHPAEADFFHVVCEGCPYRHDLHHHNHRSGYPVRVLQGRTDAQRSAAQHAESCTGTRRHVSTT